MWHAENVSLVKDMTVTEQKFKEDNLNRNCRLNIVVTKLFRLTVSVKKLCAQF